MRDRAASNRGFALMMREGQGPVRGREAAERIASFVEEHRGELLAYGRKVLGMHHESAAEGLVQDSVIVLLMNGTVLPGDEEEALATLFTHVRNVGRNRRRREDRRSSLSFEETGPLSCGPEDPADALVRRIAVAQRLEEALKQLSPGQAEVFSMHCIEGLSYAEIAERRGCTVSTVGGMLRKARRRLRELLPDLLLDW